jgi:phosphatidylglycerophosphatase A
MQRLILFAASGACIGYIPLASGTFGTLLAIPLFWAYAPLCESQPWLSALGYLAMVAGACWLAGRAEAALREHDSHKIVIDEIVGYLGATLFLAPTWKHTVLAFLVFRAFDVLKPFPAGAIDARWPGGTGVVLDDVAAGVYSNVVTRALAAWVI